MEPVAALWGNGLVNGASIAQPQSVHLDQRCSRWTIPALGEMELQYAVDWVGVDIGRPLSLSLPFNWLNLPLKSEKVAN